MSIAIHTPRKLISKHPDAFTISILFFLIGFMLGFQPQYSQPIIQEAQKREIEPTAVTRNFKQILVNNGLISTVIWSGWFLVPLLGIAFIPPAIMVYNVGASFGAVVSYVSPAQSIITLLSFGFMEALGFVLALAGSLLFPKYVLLKIFGKHVEFAGTFRDALTFLLYAFMFILSAAAFEALLINPVTQATAIIGGIIATLLAFYFLLFEGKE